MYDQIKDILLQHPGKRNAISSKAISRKMGLPMEDTQAVTRKVIWETAEMFNLPLVSCSKGFYIAETEDDIAEYCDNIQKRINGMQENRIMVVENFKRWNK